MGGGFQLFKVWELESADSSSRSEGLREGDEQASSGRDFYLEFVAPAQSISKTHDDLLNRFIRLYQDCEEFTVECDREAAVVTAALGTRSAGKLEAVRTLTKLDAGIIDASEDELWSARGECQGLGARGATPSVLDRPEIKV